MKIPSSCGALWTPGEVTATHRLAPHYEGLWVNGQISARREGRNFRVSYGPGALEYAYLRPMSDCYATGFYRDSVPMVAILRKDGDDLVLTFHAVVEPERGELFLPGVDA